ncbi:unnamed protein product [Calicophoron daubneyi]|uniref:Uncharacterized protein n=1 Tax=Calicophoron daubneyi TaxID=300641 RepID=A0AAV2TU49_CALDB
MFKDQAWEEFSRLALGDGPRFRKDVKQCKSQQNKPQSIRKTTNNVQEESRTQPLHSDAHKQIGWPVVGSGSWKQTSTCSPANVKCSLKPFTNVTPYATVLAASVRHTTPEGAGFTHSATDCIESHPPPPEEHRSDDQSVMRKSLQLSETLNESPTSPVAASSPDWITQLPKRNRPPKTNKNLQDDKVATDSYLKPSDTSLSSSLSYPVQRRGKKNNSRRRNMGRSLRKPSVERKRATLDDSQLTDQLSVSGFSQLQYPSFSSTPQASPKKFNAPLVLSLEDLLQRSNGSLDRVDSFRNSAHDTKLQRIDENKTTKIGKVRETPKTKRPSRLKRAILAQRKLCRCNSAPACARGEGESSNACDESGINIHLPDTTEETNSKSARSMDSWDVSLGRFSADTLKTQNDLVCELMKQLSQFQDRAYTAHARNSFYRKRTKRFVCGLREVVKYLKLKSLRLVLLAQDLEGGATRRYQKINDSVSQDSAENGKEPPILEQILLEIWKLACESDPITPILITHSRRKLGYLCHKPGRVSVVGVISVAGAENFAADLLALNTGINLPSVDRAPSVS